MAPEKATKGGKGQTKGRGNLMAKALSERAAALAKQEAGTAKGKETHPAQGSAENPPVSGEGFSIDMPARSNMISP